VKEYERSNVGVTKALVEEVRVLVEMPDALVTLVAMLQMHIFLCQANHAQFIQGCEFVRCRRIHLLAKLAHNVSVLLQTYLTMHTRFEEQCPCQACH